MHPSSARRYRWGILALVMLAQFLPPLVLFSLGALAPLLRDALALSHGQIGFLAALFSISAGLFAIPSGWGADKLGVRVLLSAVQAVGGLALVAAAWLRTYHELCLVMFLAGMTFTTVLVITSKAIAEWFPRAHRAAAMGAKSAALAGAGIVAGAVMPPLAWGVGWRQAFALMGGLMLASACCALLLYRDRPQATSPAGSLPTTAPQRSLWCDRHIWWLAIAGFFFGGVQYSFTTHLALFLSERRGVSSLLAASLLAQAHVGAVVSRVPYGWLSDRWLGGDCKAVLQGISIVTLGVLLLLLLLPPSLPLLLLSAIITLYGLTGLAWGGLYQTLSVEISSQERAGVSSGVAAALLHLGNFAIAPLFGYLVDVTGSYTMSWGLLMLAQFLGIVLLGWVRTAPVSPRVMTAYGAKSAHPRWWWSVTAAASLLTVAGLVGLLLSPSQLVSERGARGLVQRMRSLLAGAGVETAPPPIEIISSPAMPALSTLPPPTNAASPIPAPAEMPTPSVQVALLPDTPAVAILPPPAAATARVPSLAAHDLVLPLETATSEPLPVIFTQPEAPQATPEVVLPSKTAQSTAHSRTSQSRTGTSRATGSPTTRQTPPASSPQVAREPSVSTPRMEASVDGQTGRVAAPALPPPQPASGARQEDKKPAPRRPTAAHAPHVAALSETPKSADPSGPTPRSPKMSKREPLSPAPVHAEGRARTGMPEPSAALQGSPTPAASATMAPSSGVRLPEGPPQLVIEAGGHTAVIRKLIFTADGHELISVSDDKTIRIWTVAADGRRAGLARTIRGAIGDGRAGTLVAAALSPPDAAGRQPWLAVGGLLAGKAEERYAVRLHDHTSGEVRGLLRGHHDMILALAFSPTGRWLASAGKDDTIRIWDLTAPTRPPLVLSGHTDHIYDLAWSAAGDRLASASYDRTVGLWNTEQLTQGQMTLVSRLRGHDDRVQTVAFHPSGTVLASGGIDQTIRLWQASDGAALGVLVRAQHKISALAFAPDGQWVLAGNATPPLPDRLTLFAYPSGKPAQVFTGHHNLVLATAFHPSGQWVATGGGEHKEILLWQARTGEVLARLEGKGRTIYAVGFSPDGRYLSWGQTAAYTSPNRQGPLEYRFDLVQLTRLPGGLADAATARALERVGSLSLSTEQGGAYGHQSRLHVHDGARRLSTIERGHTDGYRHSAYTLTADGHGVLSGGLNGVLQLYALDGTLRADLMAHTGEIKALAVSIDGRWALSGANDQTLCLWALPEVLPAGRVTLTPTLSLFPTLDGEWVAWTPEGYFAASLHGAQQLGYSRNQGIDRLATYLSGEQLREHFYRPEVIQAKLHGEPRPLSQNTASLPAAK